MTPASSASGCSDSAKRGTRKQVVSCTSRKEAEALAGRLKTFAGDLVIGDAAGRLPQITLDMESPLSKEAFRTEIRRLLCGNYEDISAIRQSQSLVGREALPPIQFELIIYSLSQAGAYICIVNSNYLFMTATSI